MNQRYWYRQVYLKSDRWKTFRSEVLKEYCFCCDLDFLKYEDEDREWLELHHISYRNLGTDKEIDDLVTVCSLCHDDIHFMIDCKWADLWNAHSKWRDMKQR